MDRSVCNDSDSDCEVMGVENIACSIEKTNSLPPNTKMEFWYEEINSALRINPDDIASQLTILDFPMFETIHPKELTSVAWTKKTKFINAPNVTAFSKRFNQVSYWTIDEILKVETPKGRAEVMAHFIKVAKRLLEHNNIHSLFAVVSALRSASIFRLIKTWSCLSKKEKHVFDKLADLFSESDNWANLREYLSTVKLPCIPYLGIFLTDLVYVDNLSSDESKNKNEKFYQILNCIMKFKSSDYSYITPQPSVQEYLQRIRFIEELQKFQEDNHYKLSLKYEPNKLTSASNSKESIRGSESLSSESSSSSRRVSLGNLIPSKHFSLGHRKSRSLGAKFRSTSLPRNFLKIIGSIGLIDQPSTSRGVNLLDDSLLENSPPPTTSSITRRKSYGPGYFSSGSVRSDYKKEPAKMLSLEGWEVSFEKGIISESFNMIHENTGYMYGFKCDSVASAKQWVTEINKAKSFKNHDVPTNLMSFD